MGISLVRIMGIGYEIVAMGIQKHEFGGYFGNNIYTMTLHRRALKDGFSKVYRGSHFDHITKLIINKIKNGRNCGRPVSCFPFVVRTPQLFPSPARSALAFLPFLASLPSGAAATSASASAPASAFGKDLWTKEGFGRHLVGVTHLEGFHQRHEVEDEYEDEYDNYEEEGFEDEDDVEQEAEEEQKPSKEEMDFLKLREKLKEKFREKMRKQTAKTFGKSIQSQDRKRISANDNFGSFFGPSQPVIASRVIDESRSIRQTQHIISKPPCSSSGNGRASVSVSSERKSNEHHPPPKIDEVKRKAQALKDMRDYSFLLSDDADFPEQNGQQTVARNVSASQAALRNVSVPKPDARSGQAPTRSNVPVHKPMRPLANGHASKNPAQVSQRMQTKAPMKGAHMSKPALPPSEHRKLHGNHVDGSGQSRPVVPKNLPKDPGQHLRTNNPNTKPMNGLNLQQKPATAKPYNASQTMQKRTNQDTDRVRTAPKPAQPSLKTLPSKPTPSYDHLKKKPLKRRSEDDDDDADEAIQMIRKMFRYNPNKYAGMDEDDSDMEAGFSQIQKEERRSAKIAKEEDEEQLRLIEEEERRERMRKKQKLNRR
ncbi:hypothetical protein HPP92_024276 [Vanilla planifolia]|uniref:SPT2 chromatin protein n=1 Tax=Vanilla planifolia TaxID=51239 RepID=A0A835UCT1_VANPL|nr:hypothetical protein HPP92_024603 [Vanilla planifolia]KAG0456488.1 hypothetical protein HPP92_024276 [Vanilla planifolia]